MNPLKQWDRFGIYLLLMSYGAYSTVYPIVSFERAAPHWAEIMLGVEFFASGLLLMLGMSRSAYRMAGLLVVCIGLTTISVSIAIVGGTRVLAYAFLFGAFAMQSIHDIRQERRDKKKKRDEELKLVAEIVQLVNGANEGAS